MDSKIQLMDSSGSEIESKSSTIVKILKYLNQVAPVAQNLLLTGESGTGKEEIARLIHKIRAPEGIFVSVNLAGIDDHILNDMLFGHKRGAFTGATDSRMGLIKKADKGTLFLDEIGDISPVIQAKLLRLAQFREFYPLGSDELMTADLCIITATNHDLAQLIKESKFRLDLYYRLSAHVVSLPALRERKEDLPDLIMKFGKRFSTEMKKQLPKNLDEFHDWIENYDFPGNVRELENIMRDLIAEQEEDTISYDSLKEHMQRQTALLFKDTPRPMEAILDQLTPLPTIEKMEEALIREAVRRMDNNYTKAAQILGITRQTLSSRYKKEQP